MCGGVEGVMGKCRGKYRKVWGVCGKVWKSVFGCGGR